MSSATRDQAIMLGARKSLVGIITQRLAGETDSTRPAVVILNAGIIHRVGPNRMFVRLSRVLAAAGHIVIRFDLSGIGDSSPRPDGLPPFEASLADIRELLDSIQTSRGIDRVLLVGLCSGANQAIVYAGSDSRVKGVALIDPAIPRTIRYYVRYYGARAFRRNSWLNFTSVRHPFWGWLRSKLSSGRSPELEFAQPDLQSAEVREFLELAYSRAVSAAVKILAVFTGDLEQQHNYREQLLEAFPKVAFGSQLQLEYFGRSDHIFSLEADRQALICLVANWAGRVAAPAPGTDATLAHAPTS